MTKTTSTHASTALAKIQQQIQEPIDPSTGFPCMLHRCLSDIEALAQHDDSMKKLTGIIGWQRQGTMFRVHDRKKFEELIMPVWFIRLKYSSFIRQLTLYGFQKIQKDDAQCGVQKGAMYHELFLRGHPQLAEGICKIRKKQFQIPLSAFPASPSAACPLQNHLQKSRSIADQFTLQSNTDSIMAQDSPGPAGCATVSSNAIFSTRSTGTRMFSYTTASASGMPSNHQGMTSGAACYVSSYASSLIEEEEDPQDQLPEIDVSNLLLQEHSQTQSLINNCAPSSGATLLSWFPQKTDLNSLGTHGGNECHGLLEPTSFLSTVTSHTSVSSDEVWEPTPFPPSKASAACGSPPPESLRRMVVFPSMMYSPDQQLASTVSSSSSSSANNDDPLPVFQ